MVKMTHRGRYREAIYLDPSEVCLIVPIEAVSPDSCRTRVTLRNGKSIDVYESLEAVKALVAEAGNGRD